MVPRNVRAGRSDALSREPGAGVQSHRQPDAEVAGGREPEARLGDLPIRLGVSGRTMRQRKQRMFPGKLKAFDVRRHEAFAQSVLEA
jgi:hypothetical protein